MPFRDYCGAVEFERRLKSAARAEVTRTPANQPNFAQGADTASARSCSILPRSARRFERTSSPPSSHPGHCSLVKLSRLRNHVAHRTSPVTPDCHCSDGSLPFRTPNHAKQPMVHRSIRGEAHVRLPTTGRSVCARGHTTGPSHISSTNVRNIVAGCEEQCANRSKSFGW
ncbi:hypothetical protein BC834DRAFT_343893 [Gloeopeniophorella convolvens]|nr:hypothetical protein BC834DRAFT_343893 [Gloeopeniophorella convolvens]